MVSCPPCFELTDNNYGSREGSIAGGTDPGCHIGGRRCACGDHAWADVRARACRPSGVAGIQYALRILAYCARSDHKGSLSPNGITMPFQKLLIANRGEIAIRIARAAAETGLRAVAIYPADDAPSLHVRTADESHEIP